MALQLALLRPSSRVFSSLLIPAAGASYGGYGACIDALSLRVDSRGAKCAHDYQSSRGLGMCNDSPNVVGPGESISPISHQSPHPNSATLKRLLKISRPGSLREKRNTDDDLQRESKASGMATAPEENQAVKDSGATEQEPLETSNEWKEGVNGSGEFGFKYKGPEPTLYGDWAHKGRVSDF